MMLLLPATVIKVMIIIIIFCYRGVGHAGEDDTNTIFMIRITIAKEEW